MPIHGFPRATKFQDTRTRRALRGSVSGGDNAGTVTSVALTMPGIFIVTGSPITTGGTFAVTLGTVNIRNFWAGGITGGAATPTFRPLDPDDIAMGADALTYAATISISTTNGKKLKTVTTTNAIGNSTFNAADAGIADQDMFFIITNDATAPRTITFNTNFYPNGTVIGTQSKISTIWFKSDGTAWREMSRTVGF